jgi:hypothetical protein
MCYYYSYYFYYIVNIRIYFGVAKLFFKRSFLGPLGFEKFSIYENHYVIWGYYISIYLSVGKDCLRAED